MKLLSVLVLAVAPALELSSVAHGAEAVPAPAAAAAEAIPSDLQQLRDLVAGLDRKMFDAYNAHDVDGLMAMFSDDLEFYHDTGGMLDHAQVKAGFTNVFANNKDIRRDLVDGTLEVYPVKGYGAMEIGAHRFCHTENGKADCGTFKFMQLWRYKDGAWQVTRDVELRALAPMRQARGDLMNRRTAALAWACLFVASPALSSPAADAAAPSATGVTTLRCGTLIDGRSATPRRDVAIRIEDGRIVSVGAFTASDGHRDRPLAGHLPAGPHRRARPRADQDRRLPGRSPAAVLGLQGAARSRRGAADAARPDGRPCASSATRTCPTRTSTCARRSRRACSSDPRLTGAGHYFSITGGGGDLNFLAPEHQVVADGLVVDGVDAARKAVREEVKHGSDWIKVLASGAMMSAGNDPNKAHFSPEELRAIVEEATRLGVPVAAHAHSAAGIKALDPGRCAHDRARYLHRRRGHPADEGEAASTWCRRCTSATTTSTSSPAARRRPR